MTTHITEGRYCDPATLIRQIGGMTVMAMSGGLWGAIRDKDREPIGVAFPCGGNRYVAITLAFSDTYTVRRYRRIVRGSQKGQEELELELTDVYCDEISEVAYQASCWR